MTRGRLTRQELGWLLTQEAQGAAARLRMGVQVLKSNVPPVPDAGDAQPGVDATLDALDDAMRMLSNIHKAPSSARGRRGRIDLASLLWEVAPDARVSIEPGSGTEVSGDEGELRRMMNMLVGHGSGSGSAVTIKRDGDYVRVGVVLGPDRSGTAESEGAWLSRMAIRYGGRHELEGGMEVLSLPADGAGDEKESDLLRKELDEARRQGEAYARELAQAFVQGEEAPSSSTFPPSVSATVERVSALTRFAGGAAAELRGLVAEIGRDVQQLRAQTASGPLRSASDETGDPLEAVKRRLREVHEFVSELAMLGEVDPNEALADLDLVELVRVTARSLEPLTASRGVELRIVTVPEAQDTRARARMSRRAAGRIVRGLLGQAIAATPRGRTVDVTIAAARAEIGTRLTIDDAGASLPASARRAYIALELEPSTFGRPSSLPLFVCSELVAWQGAVLELGDAPAGGLRVSVHFAR